MTTSSLSTQKPSDLPHLHHLHRTIDTAPTAPRVPEWPGITPAEVRRIVRDIMG